jgi:PKD repeat protein
MKNFFRIIVVFLFAICFQHVNGQSQKISYPDPWSAAGFNLTDASGTGVSIDYSISQFNLEEVMVKGQPMKSVGLPGAFLFNETGAPNLPGYSRNIAIPQGATAKLRILSLRSETMQNMEIAPSPRIPRDDEQGPMEYNRNHAIYSKNAFYPAEPVKLSQVTQIRGVDIVTLGITPFQYNPVTKELVIYRDLKIEISFEGGNGHFGDDRLRSRWWDPILEDAVFNYSSLPKIDYDARIQSNSDIPGYEYLIICPNSAPFTQWADSIRRFRQQQGISTVVKTLTEVGGNTTTAIESYINSAYNTWTPPPAAILLLGDYGTDASINIISPIYNSYCASDNIYGDVTGDHMPDISMARITANNATQLQVMCSKFLKYERNPPTAAYFYAHPISALGWQTERWFQLCSEITGGFWKYVQGKDPVRINAVYGGNPSVDPWSTATNTSTILSYFGPAGLNYIPATPQAMACCWTGGTAAQVNTAINNGAFCLLHRDHGYEQGWGEPAYSSTNIDGLVNTDLSYIFSINCLTGKYNYSSEVFTEKFHRYTKNGNNSGALGLIAASEVSYSFVNDTYLWGMIDNFWPNFMPSYGTTPASRGFMPCFGNSAGKYFLQQSNWPYNTGNKQVTYNLFHHHGDAFSVVYSEIPQSLTVSHNSTIPGGATTFQVTANDASIICLSLNDVILATATGTGAPVSMTIPGTQVAGDYIRVTVTKQNYFRYSSMVQVVPPGGPIPDFTADSTSICLGLNVDFTDLSTNNPTSWTWSFPGGTPATSNAQNPQNIVYNTAGNYNVTLTVSNGIYTNSTTKTTYIHVNSPAPMPMTPTGDTLLCENSWNTAYRIFDIPNATSYNWVFTPDTAGVMSPLDTAAIVDWTDTWTGYAYIKVQAVNGCGTGPFSPELAIHLRPFPAIPDMPAGAANLCESAGPTQYTTQPALNALSYSWKLEPTGAGTISGNNVTGTVTWNPGFTGTAQVSVKSENNCNESLWSDPLDVMVSPYPQVDLGADTTIYENQTLLLDAANTGSTYLWSTGANTQTITAAYSGNPSTTYWVDVTSNTCLSSDTIIVTFDDPVGIRENSSNIKAVITPNPNNGVFMLQIRIPAPGDLRIEILNVLGTSLYSKELSASSATVERQVSLPQLPQGVYYLNVHMAGNLVTEKFVIQK